ncbi:TonB-dependent receptor [Flavitalea sp. BT771]|uniref:SusC/RagA family TonB-linked outer membrane protein n=1 Tax=Flavitalea sp. BT771 TaxID=3063329 RepID=UPI0026E2FBD0|nr:TonB-dependent receptor [Flavitalea sp. BT771]MDO6430887.1 TonB-dependent receptor [Flavitalea sp. BT771]MDV6218973.1 TonB-dependent receptor [Flavitalea sp. BT771]
MTKRRLVRFSAQWLFLIPLLALHSAYGFTNTEKFRTGFSPFQSALRITGKVSQPDGQPLAGATVSVKGTQQSATTDKNGNFSITVPDANATLVISFVGFATRELQVGDRSQIDVTLQSASTELTNVVVMGYGTQTKRDVTGAVKSLKTEDFNRGVVTSPEQLIQGKAAGVNVTSASGEPGASIGISIRGAGGIRTGNTPLFVIDGLPLDNSTTGGGDPLNFLNAADIVSMDVLKDASATAIYGSRGANGVIIITTKKGRAGSSQLSLSTSLGVSKMARALPVYSADEFRKIVPQIGGTLDDKGGNTDWQKLITRTALTQNYNMGLSGGSDKLTYYASFSAQKQEGIIKKNTLDRYTGRFNATQKFLDDRVTIDANLNYSATKNVRPPFGIGEALTNNPTYPAYDSVGKPAVYNNLSNPLIYFNLDQDVATINRFVGNLSPSVRIFKGLVYKLNFGIDNSTGTRNYQSLASATPSRPGQLETVYSINRNTLIENYLTWTYTKSVHNLSALAGYSYQKFFIQTRDYLTTNYPVGNIQPIYDPGTGQPAASSNNSASGTATINEQQSFFGRVTYQYDNKYLATVNFRADGSTKFGKNNKYGYFPSFSLGWNITEEDFMKQSDLFSNLKLRAGWGRTGNQEIPAKKTQPLFTSSTATYPLYAAGNYPPSYTYVRVANPDLQWELSDQTDVGLEFGLLKGSLTGTVDYFRKSSNHILLKGFPADPVQPAQEYWSNIKDMTVDNNGLEVELNYARKISKDMSFSVGGNLTSIHNEVKHSPRTVIPTGSAQGSGLTSSPLNGYLNGYPIGSFYLLKYIGIDSAGKSKYEDHDKDGSITDKDRQVLGSGLPNLLYGFYGSFGFKGLSLQVNFNGVSGNKIYDNTANTNFYKARLAKSSNTTSAAAAEPKESISNSAPISSRYLKSGSYLRLNNVTLGYDINTKGLGIDKWAKAIRVSLTGQNLFVVTHYDGFDPEVNTDRSDDGVSSYGIDYNSYPKARTFLIGINVTL